MELSGCDAVFVLDDADPEPGQRLSAVRIDAESGVKPAWLLDAFSQAIITSSIRLLSASPAKPKKSSLVGAARLSCVAMPHGLCGRKRFREAIARPERNLWDGADHSTTHGQYRILCGAWRSSIASRRDVRHAVRSSSHRCCFSSASHLRAYRHCGITF